MARVKRVDNSRKDHTCGHGGHVIPKGDPYFTASPGYHSKPRYRCISHPFRPSELTTSARSEPLAALEAWSDAVALGIDSHDDLRDAWEALGEALSDYLSAREEALEAWEHGNSQLEDLRDVAQEAQDEWESHDIEDFDEEAPEDEDSEDWAEWDERRAEHLTEQVDEAVAVADGIEV